MQSSDVILTSDDTEPENYRLSKEKIPDLCHCRHNNKSTKNDRKQWVFTT